MALEPYVRCPNSKFSIMMTLEIHSEESLVNLVESLVEALGIDSDIMSLTGNDGIMMKSQMVNVFGDKKHLKYTESFSCHPLRPKNVVKVLIQLDCWLKFNSHQSWMRQSKK